MAKKRNHKQRNKRRRLEASRRAPRSLQFESQVDLQAMEADKLPTFELVAYTGGSMRPGTHYYPVVVDLDGVTVASGNRPVLLNHSSSQIVGHTETITVGDDIRATGVISGAGEYAKEVIEASKNGFPWRASIGATIGRSAFVDDEEEVTVNGQTFTGPLTVAREVELQEISFVALAGDNNSSATVAASYEDIDMKFSEWLAANGFEPETELSDKQKKTLKAAWKAENAEPAEEKPEPKPEPVTVKADAGSDIQAANVAEADNLERIAKIKRLFAGNDRYNGLTIEHEGAEVSLQAHAIREGWTVDQAELTALRSSRSQAPAVHSRSHESDCSLQAMQGAAILRAGLPLDSPHYQTMQAHAVGVPSWLRRGINDDQRQQAMEAAHRYSAMSAMDICAQAVRMDGGNSGLYGSELIQAAFSGSSLTGIFTTSVNASLLTAYMETVDTTMGWTTSVDVADFKTNERHRMVTGPDLNKLPRGETADHSSRSDAKETYKVHRYAKQFVIDEQDIIDDSMNALSDTPQQFGRAAARIRPDLVYAILLANAALEADSTALFDASGHNNYETSSALAAAKLKVAIANIETQQENGVNLNLRASHLIVPSELKHTGAQLINASEVRQASTSEQVPTLNTIASIESLSLVSDSRLSNGVTDPDSGTAYSGSATTWYMASSMGHTIEVGYLRGTGRAPQVRSFQLDRGQWGIGWDVKMDVGAKALDYRGLHRADS